MPIIPIHSKKEFWNLFPSKYEYIFVVYYSAQNEILLNDDNKQLLNKCLSYLDRLSNSDKYNHVLFVKIDVHSFTGGSPKVWDWPYMDVFDDNGERLNEGLIPCCDYVNIRDILAYTFE